MNLRSVLRIGVLGGLAGGAAEVAWVMGYAATTGASGAAVARGVARAFVPGLENSSLTIGLGIVLHMLLAIGLGVAIAAAFSAPLLRRIGNWPRSWLVVVSLGLIWAFNFLVVLPVLEPGFLSLLPLAATLASKLLFGAAAAATFRLERAVRARNRCLSGT